MTSNEVPAAETKSLVILLLAILVAVGAGGALLVVFFLEGITVAGIQTGLTNVAQVSGVASGLSLTGTAVLSLKGQMLQEIVDDYGGFLRAVLFGGYGLMVIGAIACALFSARPEHPAAMWVMAYTGAVTAAGLLVTAFMINGLFSKQGRESKAKVTRSPVKL
ncbi:hypothetical protein [Arthrobacter sp. TE12232]